MLVHVRDGLLQNARQTWRLAIIEGDRDAARDARDVAWSRLTPRTPPAEVDKMMAMERREAASGAGSPSEPVAGQIARSQFQDRAGLRLLPYDGDEPTTARPAGSTQ